jgi:hypothetical protein
MEDMLYLLNIIKAGGFGDIAISRINDEGVLLINETLKNSPQNSLLHTIVKFSKGGTGFLVATSNSIRTPKKKVLGLILTAAHVVCNLKTLDPTARFFKCKVDSHACKAYFIKSYVREYTQEAQAITIPYNYCLPADVAVLLLVSSEFFAVNNYEICSDIACGPECFTSGFPIKPYNPLYCFPQCEDRINIEAKVMRAFQGFKNLVYSP